MKKVITSHNQSVRYEVRKAQIFRKFVFVLFHAENNCFKFTERYFNSKRARKIRKKISVDSMTICTHLSVSVLKSLPKEQSFEASWEQSSETGHFCQFENFHKDKSFHIWIFSSLEEFCITFKLWPEGTVVNKFCKEGGKSTENCVLLNEWKHDIPQILNKRNF